MFCISDNADSALGLRLAGAQSVVLTEKEDIIEKMKQVVAQKEFGVIVLTTPILNIVQKEVEQIQKTQNIPLIITIPDRGERGEDGQKGSFKIT